MEPFFKPSEWGRDHPDFNSGKKRVRWTEHEILYIKIYCEKLIALNPERTNFAAACVKAVLADPAAKPIFHELHVRDNIKFRSGIDIWKAGRSGLRVTEE